MDTYDEIAAKLATMAARIRSLEDENNTLRLMEVEIERLRRTVKLIDDLFPNFYVVWTRKQEARS